MNVSNENLTFSGNGGEESEVSKIVTEVQKYFIPAFVLLGTAGNCLSVVVFSTAKLRQLSSSYYLAALAISDTGYLLTSLFVWLNLVDIPIYDMHGPCQIITYSIQLCSFLSVWFVVAFTVERFVAVRYPLHRPSMCTVTRAKWVLAALTLLGIVINAPVLFWMAPVFIQEWNKESCILRPEYREIAEVFNWADTVLTFLLPFVAIAVLNAGIAATVWRLARVRRTMTRRPRRNSNNSTGVRISLTVVKGDGNGNCGQAPGSGGRRGASLRSPHSQTTITKMLLLVSTVFVLLNLPSYVLRAYLFLRMHQMSASERHLVMILQHVSNLLFSLNFGINFVLYCVSGQNFRRALASLCGRGNSGILSRRLGVPELSQTTAMSEWQPGGSFMSRRRNNSSTLHHVFNNGSGTSWAREHHEMVPLSDIH